MQWLQDSSTLRTCSCYSAWAHPLGCSLLRLSPGAKLHWLELCTGSLPITRSPPSKRRETLTSWMSVCRRGKMPQKGTAQWMGPGRIARACPECWRVLKPLHKDDAKGGQWNFIRDELFTQPWTLHWLAFWPRLSQRHLQVTNRVIHHPSFLTFAMN
jgi:hypothetical protein